MTISPVSFNTLVAVLGLGLSTACIITTSEDDGDVGTSEDDGPPPITSGQPSDSSGVVPDGTTGEPDDGTTGEPPGECTDNLVLDPGFEAGANGNDWEAMSQVFGTPICDADCTTEEGAVPYAGEWWAWFGGVEDEPEAASVSQRVTIAPEMAYLSFYFQVRSGAGTGDDVFTVTLGGDTVFMATDLDMPDYDGYERIDVDVSPWADGGSYDLVFSSTLTGSGLTSFFLDEVSLVACSEAGATGTGSTGPDTEGQDSSGSSDGSGSSSSSGSSSGSGDSSSGSGGSSSSG